MAVAMIDEDLQIRLPANDNLSCTRAQVPNQYHITIQYEYFKQLCVKFVDN